MPSYLTPEESREIEAAQRASQSGIRELLTKSEVKILNRMISQLNSKSGLSPEDAKLGVALIAELRSLAGYVNRTIERGTTVGHKLTE